MYISTPIIFVCYTVPNGADKILKKSSALHQTALGHATLEQRTIHRALDAALVLGPLLHADQVFIFSACSKLFWLIRDSSKTTQYMQCNLMTMWGPWQRPSCNRSSLCDLGRSANLVLKIRQGLKTQCNACQSRTTNANVFTLSSISNNHFGIIIY